MAHYFRGTQVPGDCVKVRIVALDGTTLAPCAGHAHKEFEFAASVPVGLKADHHHPVGRYQTQRLALPAVLAQVVPLIIPRINPFDQWTDPVPVGIDIDDQPGGSGDHPVMRLTNPIALIALAVLANTVTCKPAWITCPADTSMGIELAGMLYPSTRW